MTDRPAPSWTQLQGDVLVATAQHVFPDAVDRTLYMAPSGPRLGIKLPGGRAAVLMLDDLLSVPDPLFEEITRRELDALAERLLVSGGVTYTASGEW